MRMRFRERYKFLSAFARSVIPGMYTNQNKQQQFTLINVKLRTNGIGKWNRMNNSRNTRSIPNVGCNRRM
jgi:hypothetical protein